MNAHHKQPNALRPEKLFHGSEGSKARLAFLSTRLGYVAIGIVVSIASCLPVNAVPIVYTYEGNGSGTLNLVPFADKDFKITAIADTDNIAVWMAGTSSESWQNTHISATIDLQDIGLLEFITASHTWMTNIPTVHSGGLGANLGPNWLSVNDPILEGYQLDTPIGPVTETGGTGGLAPGQFNTETAGGNLVFEDVESTTFTARFVPEPEAFVLALLAFSLLLPTWRPLAR